ncbi:hypothetical protein PINS_up016838 [Pythium insidiosum]|nr:hypothetical protein PINS_up016838 [Pythium insidiosum]
MLRMLHRMLPFLFLVHEPRQATTVIVRALRFRHSRKLRVVTWSRPYLLDCEGDSASFVHLSTTHVPPLSIFSRRDVTVSPPNVVIRQLTNVSGQKRKTPDESKPNNSLAAATKNLKTATTTAFRVSRQPDGAALVEINGVSLASPSGRSIHAFLREVASHAWKAVPQYKFSRTDDRENATKPFSCSVYIGDKEYQTCYGASKKEAKEAAAEAVLEEHLPGYWSEMKSKGLAGQQALPPQQSQKHTTPTEDNRTERLMTMDEFKKLSATDPRILQDVHGSVREDPSASATGDGQKLFKTIVSAGSTTAEGVASTKKVAKQLGAQALLAKLPDHIGKTYFQVTEMYCSGNRSNNTSDVAPASVVAAAPPAATSGSPPSKKARRGPPGYAAGSHPANGQQYSRRDGAWNGYVGYDPRYQAAWQPRPPVDSHSLGPKRDRVVEYSARPPPQPAYSDYYAGNGVDWRRGCAPYEYSPPAYASAMANGAPRGFGVQPPPPMYDYARADPRAAAMNVAAFYPPPKHQPSHPRDQRQR